ncbi:MAG: VirB8/TrbF family protein [Longimicrobiales bacterium]
MSEPAKNPYVIARSNFEGLFRGQAKEKHAWKFASLVELAIIGTLVVAYVQLASTSRVVPYVVEVDRLGQAAAFGPAEPLPKTDRRVWVRELSVLIRNLRSITPDPALQVQMIEDAYAFLDASAAKTLNEYFADPEHNPRVLGREKARAVEINSVLPVPNSDSWKVQWTETERSRTGSLIQRRGWEAYLTVKQVVPETAEAIRVNPLGLYVTAINWTQINTSDSEAQP